MTTKILLERVTHFLHHHLLKILILVYCLGAVLPMPGVWIRDVGSTVLWKGTTWEAKFSILQVFLAFLLFNAGTSSSLNDIRKTFFRPTTLLLGIFFNFFAPLVFIFIFSFIGKSFWHSPDEIQNILTGLAIVASMPIAGSSAAWVQGAGGNASLILGLVTITTLLSPVSTPLVFNIVAPFLSGDYAEDLLEMSGQGGVQIFLLLSVVIPATLGMVFRHLLKEQKFNKLKPILKFTSVAVLILLNYSNAASALPTAFHNPDWDFLALIAFTTFILCLISFLTGWFIPILAKSPESERKALMFGLGMNNNGTGLVLVSSSLPDHPMIALPIIFYNLGQQIVAGIFTTWIERKKNYTK